MMNCPNCFKPLDTSITSCDRCGWQIPLGMCIPRAEHERLMAERDARVAELESEAERRDEQIQGMIEASGQTCACGYDRASDVCLGHHPHFKKSMAEARNKALEEAALYIEQRDGSIPCRQEIASAIRAMKD